MSYKEGGDTLII